ncbi:MAG: tRNA (guanosine(37)-N1)-methyltransferase TrmD [bacterium]|nr:tRNA (guanosine(37)-N1)-methyltransferase TrmD [bacterium]
MNIQILTLFPERYHTYVESGLPQKATARNLFRLHPVQLRDFAEPERKGRVDDAPYGGGPGMVLQPGPIDRGLQSMPEKLPVVLMTPRGELLGQRRVREFAGMQGLTIVCGYYEGVDERVAEHLVDYQISIGEFVLGSGDLAALCLIEAVTRLLPGYMGSADSHRVESYESAELDDGAVQEQGVREHPQYTRPAEYRGWKVPNVLLEGHHQKIADWRREESRRITELRTENPKDD